jgi:DNA-binding response OmpR family regulator
MRSLRKKRILLVDPDERSVRVLTWRLKSLGCQVSNSRNGIHALSIASSGSYDVIMVDALLPDVSAVDFFNLLSSPRPAIVFLGVLNTQRDQIMGLGARVGCLGKPFDPEDALALAGRLLREGGFAPALN